MVLGVLFKPLVDDKVSDWLYGDWNETKYKTFRSLYAIPGIHDYFDYLLDSRRDQEYFRRYGMDYSDIHDPRKLYSTGSYGRVVNYVSGNLKRLYSDKK